MFAKAFPVLVFVLAQAVSGVPAGQAPARPPAPPFFDDRADATAQITAAIHAAATDGIRVMITWGANDDPLSLSMREARMAPEISKQTPSLFSDEYKVVNVNVGHFDRNLSLVSKYAANVTGQDLPAVTILDATGASIATARSAELKADSASGQIDAAKLSAFLVSQKAPAPDDAASFTAALATATRSDKVAFAWWSAPWCGWCHRLGKWMDQPEVAALLSKEFVTVKLDLDRGIGAKDILAKYLPKEEGIPWFVFLTGDGQALVTSDGPKGNVGEPNELHEVEYFQTMLEKVRHHLSEADVATLIASLTAFNAAENAK